MILKEGDTTNLRRVFFRLKVKNGHKNAHKKLVKTNGIWKRAGREKYGGMNMLQAGVAKTKNAKWTKHKDEAMLSRKVKNLSRNIQNG
jgi:hypothetical protein